MAEKISIPPDIFPVTYLFSGISIQLLSNIRFLITPRQTSWYPYSRTILRLKPKNWITLFQIDANKHCSCQKTWNVSVFTNSSYFEHKINTFSRYDNTRKSKRAFQIYFFINFPLYKSQPGILSPRRSLTLIYFSRC